MDGFVRCSRDRRPLADDVALCVTERREAHKGGTGDYCQGMEPTFNEMQALEFHHGQIWVLSNSCTNFRLNCVQTTIAKSQRIDGVSRNTCVGPECLPVSNSTFRSSSRSS